MFKKSNFILHDNQRFILKQNQMLLVHSSDSKSSSQCLKLLFMHHTRKISISSKKLAFSSSVSGKSSWPSKNTTSWAGYSTFLLKIFFFSRCPKSHREHFYKITSIQANFHLFDPSFSNFHGQMLWVP